MQSKRKRILTMLENGTITTDEALTLLEKLNGEQTTGQGTTEPSQTSTEGTAQSQAASETSEKEATSSEQGNEKTGSTQNSEQSEPTGQSGQSGQSGKSKQSKQSMDDFLEDLRKDFTNVSDRFMQFMQTAVQTVKEFDIESPFGESVLFSHTINKPMDKIDELLLDIDNGKITVHYTDEKEARAEFSVKAFNNESETKAKEDFLEKVLVVTDENKLRISSKMKMTKVNLDLFLPQKEYKELNVRLMNGSFTMSDAEAKKVHVKTANGKIEISTLKFKTADFETANGEIRLTGLSGEKLSAETLNGRVYIDGDLQEVEAQSLSGHVVVTTTNNQAAKIDAKTMSGSVELYIPNGLSLSGEIASNMGRLDLQLDDVNRTAEQDLLLQRSIRFKKDVENQDNPLYIFGEAKTGSVLVCYNAK
ncbi:DUF4097 family beta strand repeat protein [Sporosarcina sp. Marseille-Q4063]|uniref:DUF4097 family beta strand repeat-containing protein n=1 Tax=Sporosarcina sp. Marseille-Q4063 TaxID=2810514 RepID=UPI001BAF6921|nr:DUF4097 family beta strand repeat-containing protein [Sporosarcina sp. Marseille-Q4063]QUW23434.1 DUF4097 family beta strand repeat protein [Sporosarcina sp. Marseille-Q4063]